MKPISGLASDLVPPSAELSLRPTLHFRDKMGSRIEVIPIPDSAITKDPQTRAKEQQDLSTRSQFILEL